MSRSSSFAKQNPTDWYQDPKIYSEIVVTAEELEFKKPQDLEVKCFFPKLTPTMDLSNFEAEAGPCTFRSGMHNAAENESLNYITLTIPRYLVWQFYDPFKKKNIIPKKTKFVVTSIGGQIQVSKMRIIGFYEIGEEEEGEE